jgi:large conductance mechanosensitive channel
VKNAVKDFTEFILKGDVVALAVAVIVATAFGAVIAAFVANVLTPLIAAIGGQPDFSELDFTVNGSRFQYGLFINAVISFLIIAAVVFFLVVRPTTPARSASPGNDDDVPPPEYAVETISPESLAARLYERAADGWRLLSVGDSRDGTVAAVMVKDED